MSYLTKQNIADIYPLSPMQQGMLFHTLYDPESSAYFEQFCCVIEGALDYKKMEEAWNHLIDQYPVFRTVFNYKDVGQPVQIVLKKRPITLTLHDLKSLGKHDQDTHIEAFLKTDRQDRFDLAKGPLLRLNIFELAPAKIFFLWSYHHLILDGWCLALIMADLFTAYKALKEGKPLPRFNRPPFKNYIAWLGKQNKEVPQAFWRELLAGFSTPTPLPWDYSPKERTLAVAKQEFRFTSEQTKAIEAFARTQRITLSTLVQAAWGILLGRSSGYDDVVFGATVSGRPANLPGAEQMIGLFINSLPVRVHLEGTVEEMLKGLQDQSARIIEYGYSFLPDVKAVSPIPLKENLFESLVVFENYPLDSLLLNTDVDIKVSEIQAYELTNFDLCLVIAPGNEMHLALSYAIDRFRPQTAARMLTHLSRIILNMVASPQQPVATLEMLGPDERETLLTTFNATTHPYPEHDCIQTLIEQQVDATPDRMALKSRDAVLSYQEMEQRANQLAHYLRAKGIGPDMPVGVFIDRSIDMVVGVLGIIKAGGAYVPIETEYPKARIEYMLFDSNAALLLTHSALLERLPSYNGEVICLDRDWELIAKEPATRPELNITSRNLVYIIYTSGSTGNPKGIQIEHRGLINYILWAVEAYAARGQGSFPLYTSMSFDLTVTSMFVPLVCGESVDIMPPGLDPTSLVEKVITSAVDIAKLTPAHLEIADRLTAAGSVKPQRLNRMILGGEALSAKVSRSMQARYPGLTIYNEYGPAETVVGCIVYPFTSLPEEVTNVPIGKPIWNTRIYILDRQLNLCPIGVAGEIYISSPGVARGYLNKDDITARSFVPNPFLPGERMYRTGDLGRWREDGIVEYLGRVDYQIKIRGYRIELGEIEAQLARHPLVHDCVVMDRDNRGDKYIAAYYVAESEIPVGELKSFLRDALPDYMVPSSFMRLDALPLSPNGKVDRNALPEIEGQRAQVATEYVAPRTDVETTIAAIWQEILGLDRVGVYDNFFELGGHSLKATQAIFKIRKELALEIPLRAIFDEPTVEGLARAIAQLSSGFRPIEALPVQESYALSQTQQRLWFLDRLIPNSPSYNIHGDILLEGDLDVEAVRQALQHIVDRHESLRTTFAERDDEPRQIVAPHREVSLLVEAVNENDLEQIIRREAATPFNLEQGPLFRVRMLRLDPRRHVMLLTMHHIISDGWSVGVLLKEAAVNYAALVQGSKPSLTPLKIQYRDFAAWQNTLMEDGSLKSQEDYWLKRLGGALPMLDLPTDYPRPPIQTTRGAWHRFRIDPVLNTALKDLAQRRDVTLFMLLLSAFGVFLSRLSNQEDIIIGSPIAGRNHPDLEGLIGFFVNMVALRMNLADNPDAARLLEQVKQVCLEAYANQDYPFNRLIDVLNPVRDTSRSPVFNVMFVLQNASETVSEAQVGEILFKDVTRDMGIAKFDLTLYAIEGTDAIEMSFEYNTDLFKPETVERFTSHFMNILRQFVEAPDKPVLNYDIIGTDEHLLLESFNATDCDYPLDKCTYQFLEEQAARTPERIAVTFADLSLTYGELNARTNQLARFLRKRGVDKEVMVALMVDRSLEMEIALMGINKAGGAYVPIGTEYPEARIDYIINDTLTPLVLTQERFRHKFAGRDLAVVCLDTDWPAIAVEDTANLVPVSGPDNLAYVLYTSGSTGIPKGVACIHKGLTNRLVWMQEAYNLKEDDIILQKTPYTFDVSGWEFHWPMMYGARIHFLRPGGEKDPLHIQEVIQERGITTLHFVPSMLGIFLQVLDESSREVLKSLRRVICSGEALMGYHRDLFFKFLDCELHNLYGPTEASIDVTWYACRKEDTASTVPIGKPIANTQIYILDKRMQPVPIGVAGEIFLAGVQLARGYVNKPEKTAEAFISHPISRDGRLYKTGDLGKWFMDGNIDYLGRIDHQVKIRGNRIELGEVESALSKFTGVHDCVVVDYDDPTGKYLVAYYVAEAEIPVSDLRMYLVGCLPEYMVPTRFMYLSALPLSPNGKVDRKALPRVENVRDETAGEFIAPRTPLEEAIAAIWKVVLGIDRVGVKDNFFDLGGHSLRATQVISRMKKELGIELPLRVIFEDPTIEGLANAADEEKGFGAIEVLPVQEAYMLSNAQKRLWFLDQMLPGSSAYNMPIPFVIDGELNVSAMHQALQYLVDRHETLRTTFTGRDDGPVQIIAPTWPAALEVEDAAGCDDDALVKLAAEEAMQPFDLARGPLFRARIFRVKPTRHLFILTLHHIISDGWSLEVLINELIAAYGAYAAGQAPALPALRVQYKDYAAWQGRLMQDGLLQKQEAYWLKTLGGTLPVVDLPADRPRPPIQTTNGSIYARSIDAGLTARLRTLAKEKDITFFMLILAVLDVFLARVSNNEDIIVGSPIAGRNHHDLEGLIGFFVNSLALRTDLSGDPRFSEVLKRVKETCLGAYANQDYPFDKLIDKLGVMRDTSRTPIFTIMLAMQDVTGLVGLTDLGTVTIKPVEGVMQTSKFDLTIFAVDTGTTLELRFEYNTDLFEPATMARYAGHLANIFAAVARDTEQPISRYALMSDDELRQVIQDFNATTSDYDRNATLVTLFEARAAAIPDHPAVAFGDRSLSYAELNARANKLARALMERGVKPGVLVGLMVGLPVETVLSILGIQKAGGAYMPIDPDFPAGRIEFMLIDSATPVVITRTELAGKLPQGQGVLLIDSDWDAGYAADNPTPAAQADDIAYAIYTSGSTGKPKGTLVPHRGVVNLVHGLKKILYDYYSGPLKVAQVASFSFDASVQQIFASLLLGHTLYPVPGSMKRDMGQLIPYLIQHEIDVIDGTPSLWELLVANGFHNEPGQKLKHIIIGGEALPVSLVKEYSASGKATRWTNVYGVTESSVDSTFYLADPVKLKGRTHVPIGGPIVNTQIYLLDKYRNPVPVGVPGELYIGGDGLAAGYLNNPEKTQANFIDDPFKPGGRLYKTGDLGRWLPDGNIDFLGRLDYQVKIRGFRIELGEIESVLTTYPGIEDCVVIDRDDSAGNKFLVGYYVADNEISVTDLRAFMATTLPDFMIPVRFMRLDGLPLNTSGKVDRSALPEVEGVRPEMDSEYVPARTPIEEVLVEVWQAVLGIDKVGVYDNFFDLGGDSIISLQVVARLKKRGYEIKPKDMFEHQTIAAIAPVVEIIARQVIDQGPVSGPAPLTPIQHWFFAQELSNPNRFNQSIVIRTSNRLDADLLRMGLNALREHHDILRARFTPAGQEFMPLGGAVSLTVAQLDSADGLTAAVHALQSSLDIAGGAVFAAGLFQASDADYLALVAHHLVVDGVSWRILLEDLFAAYTAAAQGSAITLPDKTTAYRDWALKLESYAAGDALRAELDYWRAVLPDTLPAIPVDHLSGDNTSASSATERIAFDADLTGKLLKEAHRAYNTEVNDLLITALMRTLSGWTKHTPVVFDLEGHGREDIGVDITRTVGWFTTIYPVVLDRGKEEGLAKDVKYVKETLRSIPAKGFHYGALKYLAGESLPIDTGVSFNYLGQAAAQGLGEAFSLVDLPEAGNTDPGNARANLIDVIGMVVDGRLHIDFVYSRNRHTAETIRALAETYRTELEHVIAHCLDPAHFDITPSDFGLAGIDQDELDKLYE